MSNPSGRARATESSIEAATAAPSDTTEIGTTLAARYGRRALMLGAAATGAGVAASLVGGGLAEAAPAASPPVLLGKENSTSHTTNINTTSGTGLAGLTSSDGEAGVSGMDVSPGAKGFGVYGHSVNGTGVFGISKNKGGVTGSASTVGFSGVAGLDFCPTKGAQGVYGQSNFGQGVFGISFHGSGVVGQTNTPNQNGVAGVDFAPNGGRAVYGHSKHGTAVLAASESGLALHVDGPTLFKNSGLATVPAGSNSVTVKVERMTTNSIVVATLQKPQGSLHVLAAEPGTGSFTITLSGKTPRSVSVGWFVVR